MSIATLPEHRFSGAYKPPMVRMMGLCTCGCGEQILTSYVYVEWEDEYFVDRDHLFKHIGAVEIG